MSAVRVLAPASVALVLLGSAVGCKDSEGCERARMQAASSWEEVKNQASKFKFEAPGYETLPPDRRADQLKAFTEVESAAGLVFDSFAFQKITWTGAKKGRDRARKAFDEYRDKDKYSAFSAMLSGAEKKYDAVEAACR